MEYDKTYSKFIMPKLRGMEKGAKKRYAGLVNGKLEITGLEAVRGDWTPLARKFQEELLLRVFKEQKIGDFVFNFVKDMRSGKYDNLLAYTKSLRKNLDEYKVNTPHKKAAMKLLSHKGKILGNSISYVMTKDGPEPLGYVHSDIDYNHYLEKQLKPLADSILLFFNLNFEELISGQKSLLGFK
jgi:DNA polymerase-2